MLKQILAITAMNLREIPQRPLLAFVTVVGMAMAVAVMTALLALGAGLSASGTQNIGPNMAVAVTRGGASDYMGSIPREAVSILAEAPGVRRDAQGQALVTPIVGLVVNVTRKEDHAPASIDLFGLPREGFGRTDGARITKGRLFNSGLRELVVGRVASQKFDHLEVGERINLRGSEWTVVGEYESGGSTSEANAIGDAETVLSAFDRNAYQRVVVQLASTADFDRFKAAVIGDPRLSLDVLPYREYIERQLQQVTGILNFVGYFVGTIMGIGALFGILNTMYAAIDARRRAIATLRAIGFQRGAILLSVMLESLILAVPGAIVGAFMAWLLFDGNLGQVDTLAFPISVTPGIVLIGVLWTLIIGLIGGLAPSLRAARLPVASALRAT